MNRDLFLAILAMDSYNRGYGPSVRVPATATQIGQAQILQDSEQRAEITGGESAGFYATAYNVSGAQINGLTGTVISYRGSDNFLGADGFLDFFKRLGTGNNPFEGNDIFNGYSVAFGKPDGPQASLAIEFYRAVAADQGAGSNLAEANITLTGHSLGGGLAGLVAGIYNRDGYFVDPMQFGWAVDSAWAKLDPNSPDYDAEFVSLVTGGGAADWARSLADFHQGVVIPWGDGDPNSNRLDFARRNTQGLSPTGATLTEINFREFVGTTSTSRNKVGQRHNDALILANCIVALPATKVIDWAGSRLRPVPVAAFFGFAAANDNGRPSPRRDGPAARDGKSRFRTIRGDTILSQKAIDGQRHKREVRGGGNSRVRRPARSGGDAGSA